MIYFLTFSATVVKSYIQVKRNNEYCNSDEARERERERKRERETERERHRQRDYLTSTTRYTNTFTSILQTVIH